MTKTDTLAYMVSYIHRFIDDLSRIEKKVIRDRDMEYADSVLLAIAECKIIMGRIPYDDS